MRWIPIGWMRLAVVMLAGGLTTIVFTAGCDERPPPAPDVTAQQQQASPGDAASAASASPSNPPTTQELVSGEQVATPLRVIPFTLNAPKGWTLKSHAGVMMLEGPTPSGAAQIQISKHIPPIEHHAERLIEGAKKEIAEQPGPYNRCEVRKLGDVQVLEYRKLGKPTASPAIDSTGKQVAPTCTPLQWKITAIVPGAGKDLSLCEVSFVDLSREQYDLDRELLDKIFSSLRYDPGAASN